MDFEFDSDQIQLNSALATLLGRRAGPDRARVVSTEGGHDLELMTALVDGGFCDLADAGGGPLEAVLVTEAVSRAVGCVSIGARAVVAPPLLGEDSPAVVALQGADDRAPIRFGAQADVVLQCDGAQVWCVDPRSASVTTVASSTLFPLATVIGGERRPLDVSADVMLRWWRIALAAEMVGAMEAALMLTSEHLGQRRQFGRPLSAFQALRHRLSELYVSLEGARWLTRAAAYDGLDDAAAAAAVAAAADAARHIIRETHQMSGAMGLTMEYDLRLSTQRLSALRQDCGGLAMHTESLARALWSKSAVVDPCPVVDAE